MLVPIKRYIDTNIMSIQTGAPLAHVSGVIIDPRKLQIAAFRVAGTHLSQPDPVLHPEDIREIGELGMIVDSDDVLMSLDGLVRLQEIIDFGFELIGLRVQDEQGKKLGRVDSYSIDPLHFTVEQVYVKQPFIKSIHSLGLIINRSQIVSIDNNLMVVTSPTVRTDEPARAQQLQSFVNPFRATANGQTESTTHLS